MEAPGTSQATPSSTVTYAGRAFAPATGTYPLSDTASLNLSTQHDSGYAPTPIERISALGSIAPLALAALWEAAFAYEAGPLSTWSN